jgi:hypothetical protein
MRVIDYTIQRKQRRAVDENLRSQIGRPADMLECVGNLRSSQLGARAMCLLFTAGLLLGQNAREPDDYRALIQEGTAALSQNHLRDAARAFQRAIDINPSSAKAHEGLGVALFRGISDGNVRPSADTDVAERQRGTLSRPPSLLLPLPSRACNCPRWKCC